MREQCWAPQVKNDVILEGLEAPHLYSGTCHPCCSGSKCN